MYATCCGGWVVGEDEKGRVSASIDEPSRESGVDGEQPISGR